MEIRSTILFGIAIVQIQQAYTLYKTGHLSAEAALGAVGAALKQVDAEAAALVKDKA